MRATAIFFLYLVVCLALAAALSVPLMQTGWLDYPPERVLGRLAQVFVLIGLWPFLKAMGLADRQSLGYGVSRSRFLATLSLGWALGVLILLALALALFELRIRVPDPEALSWPFVATKVVQASIGGLLIGLLEETFFRGALFGAIRRREGVFPALVWSSLLYAALHVMKPGALPGGVPFDASGVQTMVAGVFLDIFQWRNLDTLAALFTVGVFLGLVRERTGHVGWCIGLHAGWVLAIQVTRAVSDGNPDSALAFLVGDYDGMIGWLAMVWIGLLGWAYWRLTGRWAAAAC